MSVFRMSEVREHLVVFARTREAALGQIAARIQNLIHNLLLTRRTTTRSGGILEGRLVVLPVE